MVSLPPTRGGAVEAYITDLAKILNESPEVSTTIVSNVGDSFYNQFPAINVIKSHSPVDDFPLSLFKGTFAHSMGGFLTFLSSRRVQNQYEGSEISVVYHLNEEVSLFLFSLLKRKDPIVYTIHNPPPSLGKNSIGQFQRYIRWTNSGINLIALKNLHAHIISINPQLTRWLLSFGYEDSRIHEIPLPVDTEKYTPIENFDHSSSDYMLFVGRMDQRKNPMDLLRALKATKKKRKLVMVGSGPLYEDVTRYVDSAGLTDSVTIYPRLSERELISYYQNARFMCFPSHLEAFPRVVIEAASCGTPVLHQRIPIFSQYTDAGFGVPYNPSGNPNMADVIEEMFEDDQKIRIMSTAARQFCLRNISYKVVGRKTIDAYRSAIDDR